MSTKYQEIKCTTACHKLKRSFPYDWDLNVYRGCKHGCKYCFARYSHQYMGTENYFGEIFVKTNIVEQLERQLKSSSWKGEIINLGGVTDNYQPAEENYKLMADIWKLLIKYKNPAAISTKSDLILRDFDLIDELSRITYVNIASTITVVDDGLQKLIEPDASSSIKRFAMLKEFSKTNASRGMHIMPLLPFITDNKENVETLFRYGKHAKINYALVCALNLRGQTRSSYFQFIQENFPHLYMDYLKIFKTGTADKNYREALFKMVSYYRNKYGITSDYTNPMESKLEEKLEPQLSLF